MEYRQDLISRPAYGRSALFGLAVAGANPTVEPELNQLLLPGALALSCRLANNRRDPWSYFREYIDEAPDVAVRFRGLDLKAVAFACSAATYVLGGAGEEAFLEKLEAYTGWKAVSTGMAMSKALEALRVEKIALITPYSNDIHAAAVDYWKEKGIAVVEDHRVETQNQDVPSIYNLSAADALTVADRVNTDDVDAVLLSGTGMPSLAAIKNWHHQTTPTLSANLCLAWYLMQLIKMGPSVPNGLIANYQ